MHWKLLFGGVHDDEVAGRIKFKSEMILVFPVVFISSVDISIGGAIFIDGDSFDAFDLNAVMKTEAIAFEHRFQLSHNGPVLTFVSAIPILRHKVHPPFCRI